MTAQLRGVRPSRTFRFAVTKYLLDYAQKKSIKDDAVQLHMLDPLMDGIDIRQVHMGSLLSGWSQNPWASAFACQPLTARKLRLAGLDRVRAGRHGRHSANGVSS